MNRAKLEQAFEDAEIFIERCEEVMRLDDSPHLYPFQGSKETANLRRQSMELTNSLAELRKPG